MGKSQLLSFINCHGRDSRYRLKKLLMLDKPCTVKLSRLYTKRKNEKVLYVSTFSSVHTFFTEYWCIVKYGWLYWVIILNDLRK